jgi:hypothetical protein
LKPIEIIGPSAHLAGAALNVARCPDSDVAAAVRHEHAAVRVRPLDGTHGKAGDVDAVDTEPVLAAVDTAFRRALPVGT